MVSTSEQKEGPRGVIVQRVFSDLQEGKVLELCLTTM
jgi:hypothetical protein